MHLTEDWLVQKVEELSEKPEETRVLEIGCWMGFLTKELRDKGYLAEGLDVDNASFWHEGVKEGWLHHANATNMAEVFGDREFDMIVSHAVCSRAAVGSYLSQKYYQGVPILDVEMIRDYATMLFDDMFSAAYDQMKPGGHFIHAVWAPEKLFFNDVYAREKGFEVKEFDGAKIVLQKPE